MLALLPTQLARRSYLGLRRGEVVGLRWQMEILGHSQIGVTLNVYAYVLPETLKDAIDKLADLFEEDQQEENGED
ncbi:MAG TPA: hypothetical protein VF897_11225 [Roseiflexaceae bacterium]